MILILSAALFICALSAVYCWLEVRDHKSVAQALQNLLRSVAAQNHDLTCELRRLKAKEAIRQTQRVEASRKAALTASARADARRAKSAAEAPARTAQTMAALSSTKFRSRAQVVAPIKAARTRAQNQSKADVAAQQG